MELRERWGPTREALLGCGQYLSPELGQDRGGARLGMCPVWRGPFVGGAELEWGPQCRPGRFSGWVQVERRERAQ